MTPKKRREMPNVAAAMLGRTGEVFACQPSRTFCFRYEVKLLSLPLLLLLRLRRKNTRELVEFQKQVLKWSSLVFSFKRRFSQRHLQQEMSAAQFLYLRILDVARTFGEISVRCLRASRWHVILSFQASGILEC